ncbi:hypothetical protein AAFF_G00148410 [Aldrovandia affinis]|uniref:Uncharacterized protein n=1 Tax=Aldrovandia affinis TaxID=143900 RepID=A0AAD7RPS7_9TELE|nr:hypothetical protein AAFF_G00148410 [Aldrovandia affinis]
MKPQSIFRGDRCHVTSHGLCQADEPPVLSVLRKRGYKLRTGRTTGRNLLSLLADGGGEFTLRNERVPLGPGTALKGGAPEGLASNNNLAKDKLNQKMEANKANCTTCMVTFKEKDKKLNEVQKNKEITEEQCMF